MSSHYFKILQQEIIALSVSDNWLEAKKEWVLVNIEFADEHESCLCTYNPIVELCELENKLNGNGTTVGNVCVKRFLGIDSDKVFDGVKRIKKDIDKGLSEIAAKMFLQKGLINSWEYDFCCSTFRKRNMSDRRIAKRREINERVLKSVSRRRLN